MKVFFLFCSSKAEAAQFDVSWKVPAILYYAKRNYHTKYDLRSKFSDMKSGDLAGREGALIYLPMLCSLSQLKIP